MNAVDIIQQELRNAQQKRKHQRHQHHHHHQVMIMTQKMITTMVHAHQIITVGMKLDPRFFPYLHSELIDEIIKHY